MNKEMLKTSLILMIYTLVAGIALSLVYTITEDKIGSAELENTITAMKYVLTDENGNQVIPSEEIEKTVSGKSSEMGNVLYTDNIGTVNSPVYEFANGDTKYYVLTGYAPGYGGNVITMASFKYENGELSLYAIKVLDYSQETPGLGAKIADENIQKRFYPIPENGLSNGIKVDKDAGKQALSPEEAKSQGVVKVSDVMTGATITPRAVSNSLNAMYNYLKKEYLQGGAN